MNKKVISQKIVLEKPRGYGLSGGTGMLCVVHKHEESKDDV